MGNLKKKYVILNTSKLLQFADRVQAKEFMGEYGYNCFRVIAEYNEFIECYFGFSFDNLEYLKQLLAKFRDFEILEKKEKCKWGNKEFIKYFYTFTDKNGYTRKYEFDKKQTRKQLRKNYILDMLTVPLF